jgi:hypothetical protein
MSREEWLVDDKLGRIASEEATGQELLMKKTSRED